MTSEEYGQYIDDFELGADVMPGESLTDYIERRRREFDSKADGGAIGIEVLFTDKKPRKNFFMGGPALEGQALSIYNSMSAYGFSDQEIADALAERGLYTPGGTKTTTPLTNQAPNIINQDNDGDGGGGGIKTFDKGFSSQNFNLGPGKDVVDYEAEAYQIGPTFKGQLAKAYMGLRSLPTPFNIASKAIGNISDFFKQKAAEKKAREEKAAQAAFEQAMSQGRSFYDQFGKGGEQASQTREQAGTGYDSLDPGSPFAKGGLATMFTRRR